MFGKIGDFIKSPKTDSDHISPERTAPVAESLKKQKNNNKENLDYDQDKKNQDQEPEDKLFGEEVTQVSLKALRAYFEDKDDFVQIIKKLEETGWEKLELHNSETFEQALLRVSGGQE